jgi:hypothetical integral membrane protein (TIGR02206 family)
MTDIFLKDNGGFSNFSTEHLICFGACVLFIGYVLYKGRFVWDADNKKYYITAICSFGAFTQLFKVAFKYQTDIFDAAHDLPLHLCNIMALVMPFIMWYRWKFAWSITFFWIMAGCAQSIFTPTLTESLPHYEAIRYWAVHAVIILGALYGWYVYGLSLSWRDALKSALGLNLLAIIIYPINKYLGSNYMYLNMKPPGKTFYDLLGPWPDYIFVLELVVFLFFGLLLIPFYWARIKAVLRTS